MLRAALKDRGYHESTYPPRGQTISRSASNASRLSSTSDASHTTLNPTITTIIPLVRKSNSESSSVSSFHSGHTFGHTNHGSCMHLRATSDSCANSSIGFNHADGDYDRADDADDGLSVSSFCQVSNHRQPEGMRYRRDINNKCLDASAMSGSTSVTSPDDLTSTMASHSISTHCLVPRPRWTSFGERESVHSHHMANQNADHVDRMEFESRLHFRATKSEGSIAGDLSYDSESTALTDSNKWTSSSVTNANTNKPVKGLRRLCRRFSWKEKRISGSSASSSSRSTAVWMPSWSLPLSPPRAKQLASEQKSCASRRSPSEQSFAVLPMWSSVSCGISDGGNNAAHSSTLESSSDARGPTTEQHICCPAKTSQSRLTILLRTAEPTARTASPKPSCTCYNRNVRGPCIFHKNLRDVQKLSKRRSREVLHKLNGTETSKDRSKGRKRISHRLSGFSIAVVAAAKRMSLDAGSKRTSVRAAPTAALTVEVAVLKTKTHHQPKEVRQLSSRSTFMTTDYHAQRDSRLLNSSSSKPSMNEHSSCSEQLGGDTMDKCEREQHSLLQDQQQNISCRRQLDLQTTPASSACIPTRSLSKTSSPSYAVRGRMRRPTLPLPLVSSILDPNICAQVSAINVCAEIIPPRPHIRARSATIGCANQNIVKTKAHSCKRRSTIATRTVTTRTTAALATATATMRARTLSGAPINRDPPYEKEKLVFFEPFRPQNQCSTYVSFHHDLSHLESGPLLEKMDDYDASKDSSCAEPEHGDPDKVAPSSPIVPSQCSKPTRAKRTPSSLPSMSLPNVAGSAVNLMISLPPSHKRHPAPPPPPPPRPRPHFPREDEGPFLTLQEYLWQKERALVATAPKSIASNCHHSDDPGSGLKGMASTASLSTVLPSSAASSSASASLLSTPASAAAPVSGLSKVTRTRAGQKRWGWLSLMGP